MTPISIHIIANQSSYHDDKSTLQCFTCVFCPQLIRNVRSRQHIDSSSVIAHPVNSDLHTWERSLKCYAKNSTYIYNIYMTLLIIDMDFLYQFNLELIAPLFTVSFHEEFEKKMVFKIFKSRQVCDWLAKWIIMLRFLDLRWPRVFRRSNVGLVILIILQLNLHFQFNNHPIWPPNAALCDLGNWKCNPIFVAVAT